MSINEVDSTLSLPSDKEEQDAICLICHGTGADEADQQLRRDCACRGTDAGFVHLACLAEFAESKSKQTRVMTEFVNPWVACPSCHQDYQNELPVDIATKLYHSSEGSIHVIHKGRWKLCM
jgi:E3 ubiquitin-protein ligase DOA10